MRVGGIKTSVSDRAAFHYFRSDGPSGTGSLPGRSYAVFWIEGLYTSRMR